MRILCLSTVDLAGQKGGGAAYSQGVLDLLAAPPLAARIDYLDCGGAPPGLRKLKRLFRLTLGADPALPASVASCRSRPLIDRVRADIRRGAVDLLLVNYLLAAWIVDDLAADVPVVLISHNIESKLYALSVANRGVEAALYRRWYDRDIDKFTAFEHRVFRRVDGVITISSDDRDYIRGQAPDAPVLHLPPVFAYPPHGRVPPPASKPVLDLGFLAKWSHWPNREGLDWFVDRVLPRLPGNVRLHLFGQGSEAMQFADPRVVRHGFVPEIGDVWAACDIMIGPMLSGAGVNVKIAEMLYNGMPTIATRFAGRGLDLPATDGVVWLDGAEDWVGFLSSPAAFQLRAAVVPASISARFAPETHAGPAARFLADVIGR